MAGSKLTGTQVIPKATLPTGSVLQVVSTTITANLDTTSTSFSDVTGMSLSITPTSATSNILVMCYLNGYASRATDSGNGLSLKFLRGATQIYYSDRAVYGRMGTGGAGDWKITTTNQFSFIDSPATTSSTTYKLQFASLISGRLVGINDYETAQTTKGSGIVLMEIAA
jgi:hypothetical protein